MHFFLKTALLFAFPAIAFGEPISKIVDLQMIYAVFNEQYAPKEWKESHLDWDLDGEYIKAEKKIRANPNLSTSDYHRIVKDFIRSSQDYHVGCQFDMNEKSRLPFSVKSANGRYFVYSISSEHLDTNVFPIKLGDELISIDDEPVDLIAQKIINNTSLGTPDTDQALADPQITNRRAAHGFEVPKGVVQVKFKDKNTQKIKEYQMAWHHQPEYYTYHKENKLKTENQFENPMMSSANWIADIGTAGKGTQRLLLNGKRSVLPSLGKVVWKNDKDNIFHAYIFEINEGEKIGFLRIPHYRPLNEGEEELEELVEIISRFEKSTSSMVIDQCNNGGGSVFYLCNIASLFAKEPLKSPRHRINMSPHLVAKMRKESEFLKLLKTNEDAVAVFTEHSYGMKTSLHTVEMLKIFNGFLIEQWESGKNLSDPIFLFGIDHINPHPTITYTKPILLLVNELDFSGGDFFPALMQDNKRAVLMGNRTSGAGGCVLSLEFPTNNGIANMNYTWTIAERFGSKAPIENLGIVPDILYKTSEQDLQFGFYEYKAAIIEAIKKLNGCQEVGSEVFPIQINNAKDTFE